MKKEQVVAALAAIGGAKNVGYIQLRNEPLYFVTGQPDPKSDELRYDSAEFDDTNELLQVKKLNKEVRVYPYDQITAIVSAEDFRNKTPRFDNWVYAERVHNQTPNRQFENIKP